MSLNIKRYRYLIPITIIFLWVLIYYWTHRIISVNIWNWWIINADYFDIENTIDLFDDTQVHEIKIIITEKEYQNMIDTYANTLEKDWHRIDVIIDGVLVSDVWIRLKWKWWLKWIEWIEERRLIDYDLKLPLFISFNKYVNQTYQWHEMISLRVESDWWDLFVEPYTYKLYQEMWQPSPEESYWLVQIDWKDGKLFLISEVPEDKYYIQKWFGDDNWILYKAWNFVDFSYLGEDPTLYSDYFTQKTRVSDYDLSPLIRMLKFVAESDDKEFEEKIDNYIDVESVLTLLAIDDFVWNHDSFGGMWSNYYLYYHLWEQKFYLLTWDENGAFLGNWWWGIRLWLLWYLWLKKLSWDGVLWRKPEDTQNYTSKNILRTRLLENERFKWSYDKIYTKIKKFVLDSGYSEKFFKEWGNRFLDYSKDDNQLILEVMQVLERR